MNMYFVAGTLRKKSARWPFLISLALFGNHLLAQTANSGVREEAIVEMSPFTVEAPTGYTAQRTLSGTRMNTEVKDLPQQISIFTPDFLDDIAATSPADAMLYSLNVENLQEFSDPIFSGGNFNSGINFNNFTGRVRGIDTAGQMRDFFRQNLEMDNYNIDNITVSSGPNAVIFGIGGTGGIINSAYKKASFGNNFYSANFRTDNEGSARVVVDLNRELLDNKLALRVIGLSDNFKTYRNHSDGEQERYFFSLTARPWKGGTINAYYENIDIHKSLPRNVVSYDGGVTAYLEHLKNGGAPYYDNSLDRITPDWAHLIERLGQNRDYWYHTPDGAQRFIGRSNQGTALYSVQTIDPSEMASDPLNRFHWSLPVDSPIVSPEHNVHGSTTNRQMTGDIYGLILTQQITEKLHLELGYNFETGMSHFTNMLQPNSAVIRVDPNLYLPDGKTDNPYKGMAYVEHWGQSTSDWNELESFRGTITYDLDLTDKKKWLGRHRFMGLYTDDFIGRSWSWLRTRTIHPDNVATYVYDARSGRAHGQTFYRWYLDPQTFEVVNNPFDAFGGGPQPDGSFVYARGNAPASGATTSVLQKEKGATAALQSYWFDSRLVTTLGYRYGWFQNGGWGPDAANQDTGGRITVLENQPTYRWGAPNIWDIDHSSELYRTTYNKATTASAINYGAVYHVTRPENRFGEFSVFYNFGDIFTSPTPNLYPNNEQVANAIGESYDFGIMWSGFNGRVGGRLNFYTTKVENVRSTGWKDYISDPVTGIEQRIGRPGAVGGGEDGYGNRIARGEIVDASGNLVTLADIAANPSLAFADVFATDPMGVHGMTADRTSKGVELELWANPTENITIRLTAADSAAREVGLLKGWDTWIEQRAESYAAWAAWEQNHFEGVAGQSPTNPNLAQPGGSVTQEFAILSPGYTTLIAQDGVQVNQNVGLRLNATVKYSFNRGALKGLDVGGSYRFREAPVIGYIASPAEDHFSFFPYPQNAQLDFSASDLNRPVLGNTREDYDMFFSYRGRIKDARYTVRLNIRNLFNDTSVIQQRADSTGKTVVYTFNSPRSIVLSLDWRF